MHVILLLIKKIISINTIFLHNKVNFYILAKYRTFTPKRSMKKHDQR